MTISKYRTLLCLAAAFFFALSVLIAPKAQAGTQCRYVGVCGYMTHWAPDNGYDDPIIVSCNWGRDNPGAARQLVYEGRDDTCVDVDGVFVRANEEISCRHSYTSRGYTIVKWTVEWDAPGWHQLHAWNRDKVGNGCVLGRD